MSTIALSPSSPATAAIPLPPSAAAAAAASSSGKPPLYNALMIGDTEIYKRISELFKEKAYSVPLILLKDWSHSPWIRDSAVRIAKNHYLLPHPVDFSPAECHKSTTVLREMLPSFVSLISRKLKFKMKGKGTSAEKVHLMNKTLRSLEKKTFIGKSCIEGGNCFVFTRTNSFTGTTQKIAFIGLNSTCYSSIIAKHYGMYAHLPLQTSESKGSPPPLKAGPLSPHRLDRLEGCLSAKTVLASDYLYMRAEILQDLGVDAVIEIIPKYFHIDLQMFITPDGSTVFVDSVALTIQLLEKEVLKDPQWIPYLDSAKQLARDYGIIEEENKRRLELLGFKVVEVPGHVSVELVILSEEAKKEFCTKTRRSLSPSSFSFPLSVNFMNGIFLPNGAFLTGGVPNPSFAFIQNAFDKIYKEHMGDKAEVWHLEGTLIPDLITYCQGGIRCSTLED